MGALVLQADALRLPLPAESVDLIVTSPPYFALRSYRDGGELLAGQLGSEATPQAFLEALWAVAAECWRVLKPTGSMFVNLGDKRSGSGGHNNAGIAKPHTGSIKEKPGRQERAASRRNAPDRYAQAALGRPKSKMLLPHRFAIGCEDGRADPEGIGWIVRQDLVWSKPNGLPESVRDRTRDAHEFFFHLAKRGDYFSGVDEIREAHRHEEAPGARRGPSGQNRGTEVGRAHDDGRPVGAFNHSTLGKLPGSVWSIPTEPLAAPARLGIDHFAAFPTEWPRRLILGWSPSGICTACGEGRRPVTAGVSEPRRPSGAQFIGKRTTYAGNAEGANRAADVTTTREITGYACDCPIPDAPTTPSVILDPFGGTGTVALVARALGRTGISVDLSADYCRLARWRIFESGHGAKAVARTDAERQGTLGL